MISPPQCRAARALLNWSQPDLAKKADIHVQTISAFESENGTPTKSTLEKITFALENAGIFLLPGSGVQKREEIINILDTQDALKLLLDDIFENLKDTKGEVLIYGLEESKDPENKEYVLEHIKRLQKNNISERIIINKGDHNILAPKDFYKTIDNEYFSPHPFILYANKIAFLRWKPKLRVMMIDSPIFYSTLIGVFNFVWERAEPLK